HKIKKHQKADGSWDNQAGWAPILAESIGGKGLNRARQNGAVVADQVLARADQYAAATFAQNFATTPADAAATSSAPAETARFSGPGGKPVATMRGGGIGSGAGSAGVELYARAANIGFLQESVNTNQAREVELKQQVASARTEPAR